MKVPLSYAPSKQSRNQEKEIAVWMVAKDKFAVATSLKGAERLTPEEDRLRIQPCFCC